MAKWLLAVDGSESAKRASRHVAKLAQDSKSPQVHVLNVRNPLPKLVDNTAAEQQAREAGREVVTACEKLLREASVACVTEVLIGEAAATIVHRANELACDCIVVGSRGMSPLQNVAMGSIATRVISLSDLPVTLVK